MELRVLIDLKLFTGNTFFSNLKIRSSNLCDNVNIFKGWLLLLLLLFCEVYSSSTSKPTSSNQIKLRHQDVWIEANESIILNCSLRVNKDQHVG